MTTKKVFLTSFFIFFIALPAFACEGPECSEPVVPDLSEGCIGSCDGAIAIGAANGDVFANVKVERGDLFAEACGDLEMVNMAGAPSDGVVSVENKFGRTALVEKISPDGNTGFQFAEAISAQLNSQAENGGYTAGAIKAENTVSANGSAVAWERGDSVGLKMDLNQAVNSAAMFCAADGTTGSLNSEVIANSFQNIETEAITGFQQSMISTKIGINK